MVKRLILLLLSRVYDVDVLEEVFAALMERLKDSPTAKLEAVTLDGELRPALRVSERLTAVYLPRKRG